MIDADRSAPEGAPDREDSMLKTVPAFGLADLALRMAISSMA